MIGFIDSGIGGLSVLKEVEKLNLGESLVYLKDSKNSPYGNKSFKKIYNIVKSDVKNLIAIGCKLIVIACNTATAVCIDKLRKEFSDITFVGTEPNIKSPIRDGKKNILVLCTNATKKFCKNLKNAPDNVFILPLKNFAKEIDKGSVVNYKKMFMGIDPTVYDAVVLGCTHYIFRLDELKQVFVNATFYASHTGVAKRVTKIIENSKYIS